MRCNFSFSVSCEKHDLNNDRVLDKVEAKAFRSIAKGADENMDGQITLLELAKSYGFSASR